MANTRQSRRWRILWGPHEITVPLVESCSRFPGLRDPDDKTKRFSIDRCVLSPRALHQPSRVHTINRNQRDTTDIVYTKSRSFSHQDQVARQECDHCSEIQDGPNRQLCFIFRSDHRFTKITTLACRTATRLILLWESFLVPVQCFAVAWPERFPYCARVAPRTIHIKLDVPDERVVQIAVQVHFFKHSQVLNKNH